MTSWLESIFAYGPFTNVFNISGQPEISVPLGHSDGGLPIGVQLVAPYGREDLLFRIAAHPNGPRPGHGELPAARSGSAELPRTPRPAESVRPWLRSDDRYST
ncbi:MAG: amidase family protein [Jiangellaceae bacterium]